MLFGARGGCRCLVGGVPVFWEGDTFELNPGPAPSLGSFPTSPNWQLREPGPREGEKAAPHHTAACPQAGWRGLRWVGLDLDERWEGGSRAPWLAVEGRPVQDFGLRWEQERSLLPRRLGGRGLSGVRSQDASLEGPWRSLSGKGGLPGPHSHGRGAGEPHGGERRSRGQGPLTQKPPARQEGEAPCFGGGSEPADELTLAC